MQILVLDIRVIDYFLVKTLKLLFLKLHFVFSTLQMLLAYSGNTNLVILMTLMYSI